MKEIRKCRKLSMKRSFHLITEPESTIEKLQYEIAQILKAKEKSQLVFVYESRCMPSRFCPEFLDTLIANNAFGLYRFYCSLVQPEQMKSFSTLGLEPLFHDRIRENDDFGACCQKFQKSIIRLTVNEEEFYKSTGLAYLHEVIVRWNCKYDALNEFMPPNIRDICLDYD